MKDYPPCFDSQEQHYLWVQAARSSHPAPGHSYCEDCTPAYQREMISDQRCRFPGTIFLNGADGIHGLRPFKIVSKLKSGIDERQLWYPALHPLKNDL